LTVREFDLLFDQIPLPNTKDRKKIDHPTFPNGGAFDILFGQISIFPYPLSQGVVSRPGLTDCGALGKIILGGPQIKVKTKKKQKKVTATCCSHSTPITMSSTIFLP